VKKEVNHPYMPNVDKKEEHVIFPTSITPSNLSGIEVIPNNKPVSPLNPKLLYDPTLLRC
jgi:hypothetical protein